MAGPSDVEQAVAELAQSLDLAEEASVHARDALTSTGVAFYRYRQAFGDDDRPLQVDVCGKAEEARLSAESAVALLAVARDAIRDFVREVAPALQLRESSQERSSPSGEGLLDASRRPRSLRAAGNRAAGSSQDVGDLVNTAADYHHKFTFTPLTPPEISGAEARTPQLHASHDVPAGPAASDVIGTITITVALAAKASSVAASRLSARFRKSRQ